MKDVSYGSVDLGELEAETYCDTDDEQHDATFEDPHGTHCTRWTVESQDDEYIYD